MKHARKRTHGKTNAHMQASTHTDTHIYTPLHTYKNKHTGTRTQTHTHPNTNANTGTHTNKQTNQHTCPLAKINIHTINTHTYTRKDRHKYMLKHLYTLIDTRKLESNMTSRKDYLKDFII